MGAPASAALRGNIANYGAGSANAVPSNAYQSNTFIDQATGRIWVVSTESSSGSYVTASAAYYSDDGGVNWTREQIDTPTSATTLYGAAWGICQPDGQPVVMVMESQLMRLYRRSGTDGSPVWTQLGADQSMDSINWRLYSQTDTTKVYVHPDDTDCILIITIDDNVGGSTATRPIYNYTQDAGATWAGWAPLAASLSNDGDYGNFAKGIANSCRSADQRTVYCFYMGHSGTAPRLYFRRITDWDTTIALSTEQTVDADETSFYYCSVACWWSGGDQISVCWANTFNPSSGNANWNFSYAEVTNLDGTISVSVSRDVWTLFSTAAPATHYSNMIGVDGGNALIGYGKYQGNRSLVYITKGSWTVSRIDYPTVFTGVNPPTGGQNTGVIENARAWGYDGAQKWGSGIGLAWIVYPTSGANADIISLIATDNFIPNPIPGGSDEVDSPLRSPLLEAPTLLSTLKGAL